MRGANIFEFPIIHFLQLPSLLPTRPTQLANIFPLPSLLPACSVQLPHVLLHFHHACLHLRPQLVRLR
jgi:hypothetical protein